MYVVLKHSSSKSDITAKIAITWLMSPDRVFCPSLLLFITFHFGKWEILSFPALIAHTKCRLPISFSYLAFIPLSPFQAPHRSISRATNQANEQPFLDDDWTNHLSLSVSDATIEEATSKWNRQRCLLAPEEDTRKRVRLLLPSPLSSWRWKISLRLLRTLNLLFWLLVWRGKRNQVW